MDRTEAGDAGGSESGRLPGAVVDIILVSIVASSPACHAGDCGSTPRPGSTGFFFSQIGGRVFVRLLTRRSRPKPRPRGSCTTCSSKDARSPQTLSLAAGPAPWSCEHASPPPLRCPPIPTATMLGSRCVRTDGVRLAGPERCARPVWVAACPERFPVPVALAPWPGSSKAARRPECPKGSVLIALMI